MASIRTLGGSVGCAIGVTMCVIQVQHPKWLGDHSWFLPACFIWIIVSTLALLGQFNWFHTLLGVVPENVETSTAPSSTATVTTSSVAHQTITVSPTIYAPAQTQVLPDTVRAFPDFNWNFRYTLISGRNGIWRETQDLGYQAIAVDISAHAKRGIRTLNCCLYGAIKLTGANVSKQVFLNRLYWIGERANEMEFEIGKSATLFVLFFEGNVRADGSLNPKWATFQNPLNTVPNDPFYSSYDTWVGEGSEVPKKIALDVEGSLTFTVSLVDPDMMQVVDSRNCS